GRLSHQRLCLCHCRCIAHGGEFYMEPCRAPPFDHCGRNVFSMACIEKALRPSRGRGRCPKAADCSDVTQVEGFDRLRAAVGAVEETAVDAVVGLARALVCALDRERAMGQRLACHLDTAETAGLQNGVQLHLRAEDLLHAADVLGTGEHVDVAVEVAA